MSKRRHGKAALAGILAAAVLTAALSLVLALPPGGGSTDPKTESFVEVQASALDAGVYCDREALFCITGESLAAGYALATVNERSFSLHADKGGCPAEWLPSFDLSRVNGGTGNGAFRTPCDGQTFDALGVRLFGPAPRDMTHLPLTRDDGTLTVDTRPLRAFLPASP